MLKTKGFKLSNSYKIASDVKQCKKRKTYRKK